MDSKAVLIIEDEPKFRNSIKFTLKNDGYSFVEVESIGDALEVCRNPRAPKVILLDLELPDGTGRDFLERLGPAIDKFKIIVLTGHDEYLAADLARQFQVFRYLPKGPKISEALRFTTSEAFKNIELEQLLDKNKILNQIQEQIHLEIPESTSVEATERSMKEVLNLVNDSVRKLVGAYTSHIRLYDLQKGDYHLVAFAGPDDFFQEIFKPPKRKPEPFSGMIAGEKHPHNFPDLQADPDFQKWKKESLRRLRKDASLTAAQQYFSKVQSAFIAPITTHLFSDEIDAIFNVSSDSRDFFSTEKQATILEFVSQATAAITKGWQKVRKQETHKDYQRINNVLEDISRKLGIEEAKLNIYDIVTTGIAEIIRPESISLYLYNKTTGLLDNEAEFRSGRRVEPSEKDHPADRGLTALVYTSGKPLRIPNLQAGDRRKPLEHDEANQRLYDEYVKYLPSGRVDHYLGVPMIIGKEVIGAIQLLNKTSDYYGSDKVDRERWLLERGFSDDCENVLGIAASHLAVSIKNADLLEERRKQISQQAILKDVGRLTIKGNLTNLLDTIITQAAEAVQAELCLMFLLDESKSKVVLKQRYGISEEALPEAHYEIGKEGFTGRVADTGIPRLFATKVPRGKYDRQILKHLRLTYGQKKQIESLMIVPIRAQDEILGVIKVINKRSQPNQNSDNSSQYYDQNDLKFFEEFASSVGIAIDNMQRYDEARIDLATAVRRSTLSHLVASVAHEINNTHGLIPEYLTELREMLSSSDSNKAQETLARIEDVTMQTVDLSNEIGGYATGKRGNEETLDINDIVRDSIEQIPLKAKNFERIVVSRKFSSTKLMCKIHRTPLIQTIRNIIINACQAMEKQDSGKIVISTYQDDDKQNAVIEIADNGPGIEEEFRERIYDPDFTSKRGRGSGLGLWLAKRDLEDVGGGIRCESTKGKGATFFLTIPLHDEPHNN